MEKIFAPKQIGLDGHEIQTQHGLSYSLFFRLNLPQPAQFSLVTGPN
jgi:hypothetical protein